MMNASTSRRASTRSARAIAKRLSLSAICTVGGAIERIGSHRSTQRTAKAPPPARRLLVLATAGIGNTLHLLPALQAAEQCLRARGYAGSALFVLVGSRETASILRANGFDGRTLVCTLDRLASPLGGHQARRVLRGRLRALDCTTAVIAHPCEDLLAASLARLSGARRRIAFRYAAGFCTRASFLLTESLPRAAATPEWRLNARLLSRALGEPLEPVPQTLRVPPEDRKVAENLLSGSSCTASRPTIALHVGAGPRQQFKRWPLDRFAEVAEQLHDEFGARIALVGGPDERPASQDVQRRLPVTVVDAVGKLSVLQTAALLQRCDLLITNDSGPMHLAAAVDTPVVAIFGPTDIEKNPPISLGATHRIVRRPLPCSPCYRQGMNDANFQCASPDCPRRCLTDVSANDVIRHARAALDADIAVEEREPWHATASC